MLQVDFEIMDEDVRELEKLDRIKFDNQRSEILKSLKTIDIQACPGSGKTTLIAAKLKLLSKKWSYKNRGICVLSHTNVAKDEIIDKIRCSNIREARDLLFYPHFIGTIQEFINRYLGIPYLRSIGIEINLIDTDQCIELIYSRLSYKTKIYIDKKSQRQNLLFDFNLKMKRTFIDMDVPTFPNSSKSDSYKNLKNVRKKLIREGYFFFRDFYIFAEKMLMSYPALSGFIQTRFPILFIDEMQDTQQFQDELLQKIFPPDSVPVIVQRFGDPDQAIFNDINGELPNKSYNGKFQTDMDFIINKSHRFNNSICQKIKGLSFNEVKLDTDLPDVELEKRKEYHSSGEEFQHTVFVYDDLTRNQVIPKFAKLVAQKFSNDAKNSTSFSVNAVGAVGNAIDVKKEQLKIWHYWNKFEKKKSKNNFQENCFIEAVYFIRAYNEEDWSENYKFLNDCILKLFRFSGIKDEDGRNFNNNSLKKFLIKKKRWYRYRRVLFWLLNANNQQFTDQKWQQLCTVLTKILYLDSDGESRVSDYLKYLSSGYKEGVEIQNSPVLEGVKIKLSTIHSVKGQNHDATLILETKHYNYDIHAMLPYLTGDKPDGNNLNANLKPGPSNARNITKMPNQKFMRQLYVAMSRPKHLLCIAIHKDRIKEEQKSLLERNGWLIHAL